MKITVNGQEVENAHTHMVQFASHKTPILDSIDHRYGKVGDLVTVKGKLFTRNIGPGAQDLDNFDELDTKTLQNLFFGTNNCEFMDELGTPYGAYLDVKSNGAHSDYGNVTCKTSGTFVGPLNGTLLVAERGQSIINREAFSVNSKGQAFFYHVMPDITSVSPSIGSVGTYINIKGMGFDGFQDNTKVLLNNEPCDVVSIDSYEIVCKSPNDSTVGSSTLGPRGLKYELWYSLADETDLDNSINSLGAASTELVVDGGVITKQQAEEDSDYTGRLSGLFIAPVTGKFTFAICSNDHAELYLSNTTHSSDKVKIADKTGKCSKNKPSSNGFSDPVYLEEGEVYYFEALHLQRYSEAGNETNFLQISMEQYNTYLTNNDVALAQNELQYLYIKDKRILEKQRITVEGLSAAELTFTHHGGGSLTPIYSDDTSDWSEKLNLMFQWRCERSPTLFELYQGAEDDNQMPGQGGTDYREFGDDSEPFCGKSSWYMPWRVFWLNDRNLIDISDGKFFCFAYKGTKFYDNLSVNYRVQSNRNYAWFNTWASLKVELKNDGSQWGYKCVNLEEQFLTDGPNWATSQAIPGKLKIREIKFNYDRVNDKKTGYVDEVSLGRTAVDIVRTAPAHHNSNIRMETITVTEVNGTVEIEFNPYSCQGSNETFGLLGIVGGAIAELSANATFEERMEFLSTSDIATFVLGSGKVIVERISKESPKLTGTFSLSREGKTVDNIPISITKNSFQELLENEYGLLGVKVRNNFYDKCYDNVYSYEFENLGGDQPPLEVFTENIEFYGESLDSGFKEYRDGKVTIVDLGADFFRLPAISANPQVTVWVNGFLCSCSDETGCEFTYDTSLTPTLSTVVDSLVDGNIILTITGVGFTDDVNDYEITVGGRKCAVSAASSSSVDCTLENGPAGELEVIVYVKSRGKASNTLTYNLELTLVSVHPTSGSTGGGTKITIMGTGFPNTLDEWKSGTVNIGSNTCKLLSTSYTELTCITPPEGSSKRKKRATSDIVISLNGKSSSGVNFFYDSSSTPTITSLSLSTARPAGGQELTITGTSFGYKGVTTRVIIQEKECNLVSWIETEIVCTLPPLSHGTHKVIVETQKNGYADNSAVSGITVSFSLSGAYPRIGSFNGGTKITIEGSGFGNCSQVVFSVGQEHTCIPVDDTSCMDTSVVCIVTKNPTKHVVWNSGRHFKYGPGYMWEPQDLTIRPGDVVQWQWNLPVSQDGTGISVHAVTDSYTNVWDGKGFKSGPKTSKGFLKHTFNTKGTNYYNTDDVIDGDQVFMPGKVIVANPTNDETVDIVASINGIDATVLSNIDPSPPTNSCTEVLTTCVTASNVTDKIRYTFADCLTSEISKIEAIDGGIPDSTYGDLVSYGNAVLKISGSGFGSLLCQNEVMIGDSSSCTVTNCTESKIECSLDTTTITSLAMLPVSVNVLSTGLATKDLSSETAGSIYVYPKVTSISPISGSWAGGTIFTINGFGLTPEDEYITINFGEAPYSKGCKVISSTSKQITCQVPDFRDLKTTTMKKVSIEIYLSGNMLQPVTDNPLEYTFDETLTPISSTVSPATYEGSIPVSISGSGFGSDISIVDVFLKPVAVSMFRVRRSIDAFNEELIEKKLAEFDYVPRLVHNFWKRMKRESKINSVSWLSAGSSRSKRSTDYLPYVQSHEFQIDFEDYYHPLIPHLHSSTVKRSIDPYELDPELYHSIMESDSTYIARTLDRAKRSIRRKRSPEEQLLEMADDGLIAAAVSSVTDDEIIFTVPKAEAGEYDVIVYISSKGFADGIDSTITSSPSLTSISPSVGSIYGGQEITLSGNGFSGSLDDVSVTIGSSSCTVLSVSVENITCVTPANSAGNETVFVSSNGVAFPTTAFEYSLDSTPTITTISPTSGSGSLTLSVTGTNLDDITMVNTGQYECIIISTSSTLVTCSLNTIPGGLFAVQVKSSSLGHSNKDIEYKSDFNLSTATPSSGSFGGGTLLVLNGVGFDTDNEPNVTICGNVCQISLISNSEIQCRTPAEADSSSDTKVCTIALTQGSSVVDLVDAFTFDISLTPSVTGLSPVRGGTGGGTSITITGVSFASSGNKVSIDGSDCDIVTESSTEITCLTNSHAGAIQALVTVEIPSHGYAIHPTPEETTFYYIDRWSSIWTWGGLGTPQEGEFIVITEGQTILLDTSTPVLKFLLIDGGKLIFDREADGLNLQSEFILILKNGALEIGTEVEPYLNKAEITLHGHVRCTELPIYGCKTIGVREGTLDLHGEFVPMTWTRLAQTALANSTEIVLENGVNWRPGSEIVVATTGGRASMGESEKMIIASVSDDGTVITLTEPLKFEHLSIAQTFGSHYIETRAEVGLLTRNVKVHGAINQQFVTTIPACEKPFVANEEATQSCFHGKFGEEIGTDEFGGTILIHAKEIDKNLAAARISYAEFTEVGQAFRVGRYPIHFHINGNVTGNYVRGNAIHRSYNRACTIHAVSNLVVEHNIAFNIKGLSFFIEDGVEIDNIVQYNLAVYTRQSSSLLNPDIQPGSFWIVNGNNYIRHNAVAGSTHFGFWYRILKYPDGPSRTTDYCPSKAPMGEFRNNSAHSNGLYGIWLFTAQEKGWTPQTGDLEHGWCNGEKTTATFGSFIAWNNEIGVEVVESGAIRFENMTLLDNEKSGVELIHPIGVKRQNGEEFGAPTFKDSVVIGHSEITANWPNGDTFCTHTGVYSGWWGNDVENVEFYNFDREKCAALTTCARCKPNWAGGETQTKGLSFINSPNKVSWPWTMAGFYNDLDGSLCGTPGCKVVQKRDIYDPTHCVDDTDDEFSHIVGSGEGDWLKLGLLENDTLKLDGLVCDDTQKFHVVGLDKYAPSSVQFNDLVWHNEFGSARAPWRKKPPYKDGWAGVLPETTANFFFWHTLDHITNITYRLGAFQMSDEDDCLLLGHNFTQTPDVFTFNGEAANSSFSLPSPPVCEINGNTDWYFTNETNELTYLLSNKDKTRGGGMPNEKYREITFRVFRCLYDGCLPPPPPTIPAGRPTEFLKWSSEEDWVKMGLTKPVAGDDGIVKEWISIPPGVWMVLDEVPPLLTRLYIYGVLEIDDEMDNVLSAEIIMIQGDSAQLVAGFPDDPFTHNFDILLRGNHETPDQPLPNGPNLGAKALGVFGKLLLHGLDVGLTWTTLAAHAVAGSNTITLNDDVDTAYWTTNAEIVIAPTGYESREVEVRKIESISGRTITLYKALDFDHAGSSYSLSDDSASWRIAAEVGLLSRNIRIVGEDYPENVEEEFGARVLVGKFTQDDVDYRGYAKISNVEFFRAGQEGWTDRFDARYSLAFIDHGESYNNDAEDRESYVKKCAFNYNYNAAIGLFSTNNVLIKDNVVYRTLEYGLRDEGVGNRWVHNFITYTIYVGTHKDQRKNFYKRGCMVLNEAWETDFRFNSISGCERGGLVATGRICSSKYKWEGNVIHSSQEGIHVNTYNPPIEIIGDKGCVSFDNFLIYKIYDYGVYLLTHETVQMDNNIFVDCGVGVHPFLIRPKATTHLVEEKYLEVNNTVFVGRSEAFSCDKDVEPHYIEFDRTRNKGFTMWPGRNWRGHKTGHAGLLWPIFSGIGVPLGKPWVNGKPKSFPLLTGQVYINDVTFANFQQDSCGQFDSAIRTNPRGDDMMFPIFAKGTKFVDVDEDSKIWMDRPIDGLVNNEHCVDMHCDGLKKALLVDTDGKIIGDGIAGTIIADSAYEWDGNPTAGLGYYRVPKPMVTTVEGDKIEYSDKMPNKGIVRNDQCVWMEKWKAFKCHDINHRLLILESMDIDTLDRRLSPVAVLANPGTSGYIDLINGPQDFSCCFGYACQKRISNFYAIVGTNMLYEIQLTSTPPIHMRYRLKHNKGGDPILLKIWFPKPQRIDIFVGDQFMAPNNYDFATANLKKPDDSYIPLLISKRDGENYFDPLTGYLYLLLTGENVVDYKIQPQVVTKIGTVIDIDDIFEGDDVAFKLAALLGVDPSLIRVTEIVREGSVRMKRESNGTRTVDAEVIIESPSPAANVTTTIDYEGLKKVSAKVTNSFQDGSMGSVLADLGMEISKIELTEPIYVPTEVSSCIPQDDDPNEECYLAPEDNSLTGIPYSQLSQQIAAQRLEESLKSNDLKIPAQLKIMNQPGQAFELQPFGNQPKLYTVDADGNFVEKVGSPADPWIVTATLLPIDTTANLINNVTCIFMDGYCEFDNLAIEKMGSGYSVSFEIDYPTTLTLSPVESDEFAVGARPIGVKFTAGPTLYPVDTDFKVEITVWDEALDQPAAEDQLPTGTVNCELFLFNAETETLEGSTFVSLKGKISFIFKLSILQIITFNGSSV